MALTDHDTVEGCERMAEACQALGIEFITGTELTAEFEEHEVHLLGYFLDPQQPNIAGAKSRNSRPSARSRIQEMVVRLNKMGVPLRAETVFALANCRSPGPPARGAGPWCRKVFAPAWTRPSNDFSRRAAPPGCPSAKFPPLDAIALDPSGRRAGRDGPSGLEPLRRNHSRPGRAGPGWLGMFSHQTQRHAKSEYYLALAARLNLPSPAVPIATASARASRSSAA